MKAAVVAATLGALILFTGSPAACDDTKVGIALGAAVPAGGIGAINSPTLALSGWVARPIRGPYGWRAEFGGMRLLLPDETRFLCAAAGFLCEASLVVTSVGGGLQLEPQADRPVALYGYVTVGLYHVTAAAEVADLREGSAQPSYAWSDNAFGVAVGSGLRVRLGDRWTIRAELRYAGFSWKPGTMNWASLITPGLNLSVEF